MKIIIYSFFFLTFIGYFSSTIIGSTPLKVLQTVAPWSAVYTRTYNKTCVHNSKASIVLLMEEKNISVFNQLMFSWNAYRPERGYFAFFAQVRDKATQKWGVWHHMYDWGNDIQRSHQGASDTISHYEYVRLEMEKGHMADGFRIKVQLVGGAPLDYLRGSSAAVSNYDLFKEQSPQECNHLHSIYLPAVVRIAQFALDHPHKERVCSPVSLTMMLQSLGYTGFSVQEVIQNVYDYGLNAYGSWPFNIAHAFECAGPDYQFYVCRLNSFAQIHHQLMKGIPVVVSIRGQLPGAERPYAHGHLLVIVGWDQEQQAVICHDPAFDDQHKVLKYYPIAPFLAAWERSRRLTYWAVKE